MNSRLMMSPLSVVDPLDILQASTPLEQASKQPCLNKVCRVDKWQHPTQSIITLLFPRYQELSLV